MQFWDGVLKGKKAMRVIIKRAWKGIVSIKDFQKDKAKRLGEPITVHLQEPKEKLIIPVDKLDNFFVTNPQRWKPKYPDCPNPT